MFHDFDEVAVRLQHPTAEQMEALKTSIEALMEYVYGKGEFSEENYELRVPIDKARKLIQRGKS